VNNNGNDDASKLLLRAAEVALALGIGKRHLAALNSSGRLPRPIQLGRSVRWRAEEIRDWVAAGAPCRDRWEQMRGPS
jgi:predicted DNA-binding transcriptional regulator AlpA